MLRLPRNLQTSHMSKSHSSLHLLRSLSSSTITTMSKCCTCHEKCISKLKIRSLAPATTSRLWSTKARGFPCACHEMYVTMCENAHGTTTRAQSLEAPAADTQILRACAVEMHIDDVERHECTVNSNELAVHAGALQRSKHQLLFYYRKNPSVCPHCLGKKNTN